MISLKRILGETPLRRLRFWWGNKVFLQDNARGARGGPVWRNFRLLATAEQIGHHGARRICGRYRLTRADVLEGRRLFPAFRKIIAATDYCKIVSLCDIIRA